MKRRYLAEFIGTFGIVFAPVAYLGACEVSKRQSSLLEAAIVSGLAVLAMISAFGPISAAHFNPAVTLGFVAAKRFPATHAAPYIASQLAGACAAAGLGAYLFGTGPGVHIPTITDPFRSGVWEAAITFLLMLVIMAVATDRRAAPGLAPIAIGLTVVTGVLVAGQITGGSMNPARSIGPALFTGSSSTIGHLGIYILGPIAGAVLAALVFERVRLDRSEAVSAPSLPDS